ncbi:glutathione transferase GstA [Serratia microhaemolytica]|uniref:glutathione transferase GstA n=1 Tax=Serratia microhaemolytica TaxID=2675110 RepID=UPI000FDE4B3D|nr:glutathione transferase GstA [Serratia microhaemolytica]
MKLFYTAGACSLSPHIVLHEIGLDFTAEKVDLAQKKTESGVDYFTINPKGQVPALLLDDGTLLTEGAVIVQYLADQAPESNLLPAVGSLSRYQALEGLNYVATELHKGFTPLFKPGTPDEYKVIVRERLDSQFNYLNTLFAKQPYLAGQRFTIADAYLFTVLRWTKPMQLDISKYAHLQAYFDRIASRPAVKATLSDEGLN